MDGTVDGGRGAQLSLYLVSLRPFGKYLALGTPRRHYPLLGSILFNTMHEANHNYVYELLSLGSHD